VCGGHDLVESARHDDAAALGEKPPDLLGLGLPPAAGADDGYLKRHEW
jgi:hypothetical protein